MHMYVYIVGQLRVDSLNVVRAGRAELQGGWPKARRPKAKTVLISRDRRRQPAVTAFQALPVSTSYSVFKHSSITVCGRALEHKLVHLAASTQQGAMYCDLAQLLLLYYFYCRPKQEIPQGQQNKLNAVQPYHTE